MPSLLTNKQREKKKQKFTRFSQLTEKKSSALNSVKIHHMKSSSDDQYNIIEVDGTRIRDKEDNSPDQIAVQTGWISQPGQTSICLPHGLMIEIISTEPANSDNDTIIPL